MLPEIKEQNGKQVVSARELYKFLEYSQTQWKRWYTKNIIKDDFFDENVDYQTFDIVLNGNPTKEFALSIDMAKELSMLSRSEKGKQARKYFIECERKVQSIVSDLSKKEILKLALESEEEKEKLQLANNNLNTALDNLLDWVSILKVAQHNNLKENTFNWRVLKKKSQEMGYIIKKAESPRYGYQNLYNVNVFKACYPEYNYDLQIKKTA